MAVVERYDYAIIGAGFFGVRLALLLSKLGARVVLIEREEQICSRATYANQARVHNGYHYLRSYSTALGSHLNYDQFCNEMSDCISEEFDHVYGIARQGSYTNAYQFQNFCRELGLPLRRASKSARNLFNTCQVEDLFLVRECAFDALAIRDKLTRELEKQRNIHLMTHTECRRINFDRGFHRLSTTGGAICANGIFIATYADINQLLKQSGLEPLAIKAELAEICLVKVPNFLQQKAITVMDGPFFSLMPMPAVGMHSLSHVRYTPHLSWDLANENYPPSRVLSNYNKQSRFIFMKKDAQRYVPCLVGLQYSGSLFEIKAIPKKHEVDDGRPIIFHRHLDNPLCISVLGSKIDSIFELERTVRSFLKPQSQLAPHKQHASPAPEAPKPVTYQ
ncbi:MAG TPA: FAD-dependent oxidoreductase [Pseudolabrys sp.]|nr:FAD-dependent oxidoreductase [Pseudolabrys sp.]